MPGIGDIVQLDNGASARVVEVSEDGITVELLDTDGNPTGETIEVEVPQPEPATDAPADPPSDAPEDDGQDAPAEDATSVLARVREALAPLMVALGLKSQEPDVSGFKVYGNKWVGWWTNNFRDRTGEYFTEKAIDDYVWRVDKGMVPKPPLRFYHIPGTEHGKTEFVGRIGHYAIAAGTFDDTPLGRRAVEVYAQRGKRYAMSHGFIHAKKDKVDGVYHQFNTYEISVLPAKAAANPYTAFEEVSPMLGEQKEKALREFFGEELAASIITNTDTMSKALEEIGVSFKDLTPPVEASNDSAEVEAVKAVETTLGGLINDLTADSAAAVEYAEKSIKMIAEYKTATDATIADLRTEIKALREAIDLRPRSATTDPATEVEKSALTEAIKAQVEEDDYETVLGLRVKKAR